MPASSLERERERLTKLWEAYESQEKEYSESLKKVLALEKLLEDKKRMNDSLRSLIESKDREIRELEIKNASLQSHNDQLMPQMDEVNANLRESKQRYAKLYAITEELEEELELCQKEIEARDYWFKTNLAGLERLIKTLDERRILIDQVKTKKDFSPAKAVIEADKPDVPEPVVSKEKKDDTPVDIMDDLDDLEKSLDKEVEKGKATKKKGDDSDRVTVIKEFCRISVLNPTLANALYNSGYTSMEKLARATLTEIMKVKGFNEERAESLRIELFEFNL